MTKKTRKNAKAGTKGTKKAASAKDVLAHNIALTKGDESELLHHPARKPTGIAGPAAKPGKAPKKAKAAAKPKTAKPAAKPRTDTKSAIVVGLLRREKGATVAEIAKATKWQNHTIRGFISASVGKKLGLKVESAKNDAGERAYRILA